jgi:hypothetical protein
MSSFDKSRTRKKRRMTMTAKTLTMTTMATVTRSENGTSLDLADDDPSQ